MQGFVPSWIQPADEVGNLARGYQIGMSIGARQAEQAFREQQAMRQQQLEAQDKARWEAEFGLRAKQASDRATAIRAYQSDLAAGMDPVQAIIKHGPGIGQQGSVEAAALRAPLLQEQQAWREKQQSELQAFREQQQSALQAQRDKLNEMAMQRMQETITHNTEMENLRRELSKDPNKPKEEFVKTESGQTAVVIRDAEGNPVSVRPLSVEKTAEEKTAEEAARLEASKPSWLSRVFSKPTTPTVTPPGFGGATPAAAPSAPAQQPLRVLSITRRPDSASPTAPAQKPPISVNDIAPVPQDPVEAERRQRLLVAQAVKVANEREQKQLADALKRNEDTSAIVREIFRRLAGGGIHDMPYMTGEKR